MKSIWPWLSWLIFAAVAGGAVIWTSCLVGWAGFIAVSTWGLVAVLVVLLSVVVHELGHAIAAWFVGIPFHAISFDRLIFERRNGRLSCRIASQHPGPPAALWCLPHATSAWRVAVMILGGPLANLLAAIVAWVAAIGLGQVNSRFYSLPRPDFTLGSILSLVSVLNFAGLWNLLPCSVGGFRSDGGLLLDLVFGRKIEFPPPLRHPSEPNSVPANFVRYEFDEPEPVAEVEFLPPTCRPPDASIE